MRLTCLPGCPHARKEAGINLACDLKHVLLYLPRHPEILELYSNLMSGASQHRIIGDMIDSQSLTTAQMADAARCSDHTIRFIRANLHCFGSTTAPRNRPGPCRSVMPRYTFGVADLTYLQGAYSTQSSLPEPTSRSSESNFARSASDSKSCSVTAALGRTVFGELMA